MEFRTKIKTWTRMVEEALDHYAAEEDLPEKTLYKAMRYSLLSGGKRIRPVLSLAVCELLGGDYKRVLPYACALEMIHAYSLIHDDLPCMDNDDFRRGKPTNHKVFGEAIAVLAGDALLNKAFEVMLDDVEKDASSLELLKRKIKAMSIIAGYAGSHGMVGGQVVDLESSGREISGELLTYMHSRKTAALIKAAVISSALICGANEEDLKALEEYSEEIGVAFQIKDDILDVEGEFEKTGKAAGRDAKLEKPTFVSVYGLKKAKEMLSEVTEKALCSLDRFGEKGSFLRQLAIYISSRGE